MANDENKAFSDAKDKAQGISIDDLLAAPFLAASRANATMAHEQARFLMEHCFDSSGDVYKPKMISMSVGRAIPPKGEESEENWEEAGFQLPLLTLIPFNSLCVKDVKLKFDLEIVSQQNSQLEKQSREKGEKSALKANISYDASEKRNEQHTRRNKAKMAVEMTGGSIPLPVGLTTMLDIYSKNITANISTQKKTTDDGK